jgi:hypothetical protein
VGRCILVPLSVRPGLNRDLQPLHRRDGVPVESLDVDLPRCLDAAVAEDRLNRLTDASENSEPEDRTKRNPQVVVRAVVEVDLVANFKTQTHRTQARLHPSSGIHCRV